MSSDMSVSQLIDKEIYLPDGSSAKYDSKTGDTFVFSTATIGSGDYLTSDGVEVTTGPIL